MKFKAQQFTPTKWDTAEDKAWFANQFVKFVESRFEQRHFTDRFYRRLSNCFGHIAHNDRLGFWETYFTTTAGRVRFLEETLTHVCVGDPQWTYSDVERVLHAWLKDQDTLQCYQRQLADELRAVQGTTYDELRSQFEQLPYKSQAKSKPVEATDTGADGLSDLFAACDALVEFSFDEARLQTDYAQALAKFCRLKRTLGSALLKAARPGRDERRSRA